MSEALLDRFQREAARGQDAEHGLASVGRGRSGTRKAAVDLIQFEPIHF